MNITVAFRRSGRPESGGTAVATMDDGSYYEIEWWKEPNSRAVWLRWRGGEFRGHSTTKCIDWLDPLDIRLAVDMYAGSLRAMGVPPSTDSYQVPTTPEYWDCECEYQYIHPATSECCQKCGSRREEQPDSRIDEVADGSRHAQQEAT